MPRRICNSTFFKIVSCFILSAVLLQGPAMVFAAGRVANAPQTADDNAVIDGQLVEDQDTTATNFLLANDSGGSQYLNTLQSRGVDPFQVRYVSVKSTSSSTSATDGLRLLAERLNQEVVSRCGGPAVVSVDAMIGGFEHATGKLEGGVVLVANLEDGSRKVVAAMNADDAALSGSADPVISPGNFFADPNGDVSKAFHCLPIFYIIICWIRCIVFQQIIVLLRCIIVQIVVCVRIGWSIICFRARIVCCFLFVFIRTWIICFINCIVIYVGANPTGPPRATSTLLAEKIKQLREPISSINVKGLLNTRALTPLRS